MAWVPENVPDLSGTEENAQIENENRSESQVFFVFILIFPNELRNWQRMQKWMLLPF